MTGSKGQSRKFKEGPSILASETTAYIGDDDLRDKDAKGTKLIDATHPLITEIGFDYIKGNYQVDLIDEFRTYLRKNESGIARVAFHSGDENKNEDKANWLGIYIDCYDVYSFALQLKDLVFEFGKYPPKEEPTQPPEPKESGKKLRFNKKIGKSANSEKNKKGKPLEAVKEKRFRRSHLLGFGEGYGGGLSPHSSVTFNCQKLKASVEEILKGYHNPVYGKTNPNCYGWKDPLTAITIMVCEGVRFYPVSQYIQKLLESENENEYVKLHEWMCYIINNWSAMSKVHRGEVFSVPYGKKVPETFEALTREMVENLYKDRRWVILALAIPCKGDTMSKPISNIVDIKPDPKEPWTVIIQVLENNHVKQSKSGKDYRNLIFTDSRGMKVNAFIKKSDFLLTQYKRYRISNAVVERNEKVFPISSYQCFWILTKETVVTELVEAVPPTISCQFDFTRFSDLYKYAESDSYHNVRGIVLQVFDSKKQGSEIVTRRDLVIVDKEKKLVLMTLWNQIDDNEGNTLGGMIRLGSMIFGMRLKVKTFNCISLTTGEWSGFMINPPVSPDLQMQQWYNENKRELGQLLEDEAYKNSDMLLPYPKEEDIVSLVTAYKNPKASWVKGKISLAKQERSLWYTGCAKCQVSLEADISGIITCPSCRLESEVELMCRLSIKIIDETKTQLCATICTPEAEKLMPFNALHLKKHENDIDLVDNIATSLQQHTAVTAFIRTYEASFNGQTEKQVSVVKVYPSDKPNKEA